MVEFATKPQLAQCLIERTVAAQAPFVWITGDAVYGNDRSLRVWPEQQDLHFVLAVANNQYVRPVLTGVTFQSQCQQIVKADVSRESRAWNRLRNLFILLVTGIYSAE